MGRRRKERENCECVKGKNMIFLAKAISACHPIWPRGIAPHDFLGACFWPCPLSVRYTTRRIGKNTLAQKNQKSGELSTHRQAYTGWRILSCDRVLPWNWSRVQESFLGPGSAEPAVIAASHRKREWLSLPSTETTFWLQFPSSMFSNHTEQA